jgi:antirestriction protein ArdC
LPFIRYYKLFNVEQCDGVELPALENRSVDPIAEAEVVVASMPNPPGIAFDGGAQAFYLPHLDSVHLPKRESFDSAGELYSTLFHELAHSTGHPSRLDRPALAEMAPFGSETYSREELVAEFGAAFLCAHAGIEATVDNSAAYIAGWLKKLRSDPRLVIIAASQGQRAADYILNHGAGA